MSRIRLAILGSGIFARDAHLPALQALSDTYEIVAIYSRNAQTAGDLAAQVPGSTATTDLEALLAREDIDAVNVILPIAVQPAIIEAALRAGKHVISEKPVAPHVASGRELLQTAREITQENGRVWMVAENFRYEPVFPAIRDIIARGEIGRPIQFLWSTAATVNPQNKYYHTEWRRDNSFPGGFILDGGVHNIAAMRAAMGEIESVSAFVTQVRDDLPPADTFSATFRFASGAFGIWTMTFANQTPFDGPIQIIGERGNLRATFRQLEVSRTGEESTGQTFEVDNIQAELTDFARVIAGAELHSTPAEALRDVAVIHAILESGRTGRAVQPERID